MNTRPLTTVEEVRQAQREGLVIMTCRPDGSSFESYHSRVHNESDSTIEYDLQAGRPYYAILPAAAGDGLADKLAEAAGSLSAALAWRAGVYAAGDQEKMDFADEKLWRAKDALDAALAAYREAKP